ncbi:gliding motility-associated protein GldE [Aureitalea marina]|uniref:Magnesium/cobalt efflux protein n=1 Tax=Aureitalea marina TaxID=930804 RepID=A0A2S7KSS6_9FLAO|nr:gliding motility-associated protein GldE [Aureitalea marina]PQB05681.1 magnesium/cobalt efflux protein [Aureitalea marina]
MDSEPPDLLLQAVLTPTDIGSMVVLICLLFCSALISGAEVAFFSLSASDFSQEGDEEDNRKMDLVRRLLADPKKLLATILVANNLINIAIVLLFASLGDVFFDGISNPKFRFFLEVVVATFLILMFGEILPKIYASRNKVSFSTRMAIPLRFLERLFSPITGPMKATTIFIEKRFANRSIGISVDQLSQALELTSDDDTTREEQKILQGIVSFGNTDVKNVMQPRMDIFALNEESSFKEILPELIQNGYSRIPVYRESMDTIVGILYIKDLMPHLDKDSLKWTDLMREPYFVPENKKLDDLLNEFKEMKMHLAIVVDEYGGTSGLISLEDIIEEIVGEISDEFDDDDLVFTKIDDHTYVFEGKTALKDVYRVIRMDDTELFENVRGDSETLAGFVLEISQGFPRKGEVIKFHHYSFTIEAFENRRIQQIKLSIDEQG